MRWSKVMQSATVSENIQYLKLTLMHCVSLAGCATANAIHTPCLPVLTEGAVHIGPRRVSARIPKHMVCITDRLIPRIPVVNPATGEHLTTYVPSPIAARVRTQYPYRVVSASSEQVRGSIEHAHDVFQSGVWSKSSAHARSLVLTRLARTLEQRIPQMAQLETLQTGRTIREMSAQLGRLPEWLCVAIVRLRSTRASSQGSAGTTTPLCSAHEKRHLSPPLKGNCSTMCTEYPWASLRRSLSVILFLVEALMLTLRPHSRSIIPCSSQSRRLRLR